VSLETYRRKRDFSRTPEPAAETPPGRAPAGGRRFVVQRHRATRLHYDFRLEVDGVLMSWAVPKGPSLNPADRRMAVHTEDHPLDYFDFEGVIPKGEYGGGDVIVWDWGTFEPEETGDPAAAVRAGELKFSLDGEKLHGRFTLVRIRSDDPAKDDWLLIHKKDEHADAEWDVDALPRSVKTGRTNDEVAAGAEAVWDSRAPAAEAEIDLRGARQAPLPDFVAPMQATAVDAPFSDPDWLFELKLDGYRIEAVIADGRVKLWTRNRQDAARYFPDLAAARPTWIKAATAIVDGEVVALDPQGRPDFSLLQVRAGMGRFGHGGDGARADEAPANDGAIVYHAFDLLYLDGRSLLDVALEQRKRLLRSVLRDHPLVRYGSHVEADGEEFHRVVAARGLEGIVAKLRTSRYESGRRSRAWLKIKIRREQEFVVVGYEPGKGSHADLGSLILAVRDGEDWRHVGEVGSGLDALTRRQLRAELDGNQVNEPAVANPPRVRGARWAAPRLVVRVEFAEWTREGLIRQAAYKGIAIDRDPRSVVREREQRARETADRAEKAMGKPGRRSRSDGKPDGKSDEKSDGKSTELPQAATAEELAALDGLGKEGDWQVGGQTIHLTNLDKLLFPGTGHTKRDLIRYYVRIAPVMLPYLRGRALNLSRWPDGVQGKSFWQKEVPAYAPEWIGRWAYPEAGSSEAHTYIVADQVATMAWLANHATIDIHPWTSRTDAYKRPTYALVDIDPGTKTTFEQALALARLYRSALDHLGVVGLPKVTGKRGIQVWIPIKPTYTFAQTRDWVETVSRAVGATLPELVAWEWQKSSRRGLARLDYTQNAVNKTLVAPYAVRPVAGAAVSAPIEWDELDSPDLLPDGWDINTIFERIDRRGDLFAPALELQQDLPPVS
jgi:bifunctional non-homologous end joining protein LigD